MSIILFNLLFELANLLLLINLFLITRKFIQKKVPSKLFPFFFYLIISVIEYLFFELRRLSIFLSISSALYIDLFFGLMHYVLLSATIIYDGKICVKKYLLSTIIASVIFICFFIYRDILNGTYYSVSASNFSLILVCIVYIYELLISNDYNGFNSNPLFYILIGVFVGTTLIFPILLFGKQIKNFISDVAYYWVACIAPFSSIIMYSLFIKGINKIK